jgi:hypothetical protein
MKLYRLNFMRERVFSQSDEQDFIACVREFRVPGTDDWLFAKDK